MNPSINVSAIVPARNEEETIAAAVTSLAAQPEIAEVIVVNDQSTDRTAEVLRSLSASAPKLRLLESGALPPGWVGKNHALSQGAAAAKGNWLLFTDADAVHLPGSAGRALETAAKWDAAVVSYSPEQVMRTWWEKALIPFVYTRLAHRFLYGLSDPHSSTAVANGQYLLIRKDAYQAIGGHAGVAGEVLEDVALARRARQAGYQLYFAPGNSVVRVRMYRTFAAMWEGWTKNLYPLMGGTRSAVWAELRSVVPWIPLLMLPPGVIYHVLAWVGLLLLAGRHAVYAGVLRRNRFPVSGILYYMPGVALYAGALVVSARRYARGTVSWKGREYPVRIGGS
ncbi:MAG TPA: glycosyltransferase [Candidatus Acidoferrales bacterium]|nr:glycosyltransferase [Candidatus Acidoferrales bacterium]